MYIDPKRKFIVTLNAIYGFDPSYLLPMDRLEFKFSKRTGKIKHVMLDGKMIASLRSDGNFALTIEGARLLLRDDRFKDNCIIVRNDVKEFILKGSSVFCKHVVRVGNNIKPRSEVAILDQDGNLLAVGIAVLSADMIKAFNRGVAAKVRHKAIELKASNSNL